MLEKRKEKSPKTEKVATEVIIKDFDDLLDAVGSWNRFQVRLMIMCFPFNLFLGYVYLSSVLINYSPPHWCKVDELINANISKEYRRELSIPKIDGEYSNCYKYAPDWSKVLFSESEIVVNESWPIVHCDGGWEYDTENFHKSVVSDFDWVCEDSWIPTLSQAIFYLGAIPGTLAFGYISDKYGRIPVIVAANVIAMAAGVGTTFVYDMTSYFVLRFITGISHPLYFSMPYVLVLEYVDKSKRTLVGNLGLALFLTISGIIQPWLIKYTGDWKIFSWIIFPQMIIALAVPFVMPESSRWLQSVGREEEAVKVMKKIAKINRKEVSEEAYTSYLKVCKKEKEDAQRNAASFLDLFRHARICKNTLMVVLLFVIISCLFDASVRNISNLDVSIYIAFMVSTALELPADLLSIVGLTYIGRRFSAAISIGSCGLCMLIAVLLKQYVYLSTFFALSGRFFATYAMNTGFQYTVEVMPTCLRGQGIALANVMSTLAQVASPYIVYSSTVYADLPFYLMAAIGLLGVIPGLVLPETADTNLPNTIEEAKQYGRYDRFFWMPWMGNERRYKKQDKVEAVERKEEGGIDNKAMS